MTLAALTHRIWRKSHGESSSTRSAPTRGRGLRSAAPYHPVAIGDTGTFWTMIQMVPTDVTCSARIDHRLDCGGRRALDSGAVHRADPVRPFRGEPLHESPTGRAGAARRDGRRCRHARRQRGHRSFNKRFPELLGLSPESIRGAGMPRASPPLRIAPSLRTAARRQRGSEPSARAPSRTRRARPFRSKSAPGASGSPTTTASSRRSATSRSDEARGGAPATPWCGSAASRKPSFNLPCTGTTGTILARSSIKLPNWPPAPSKSTRVGIWTAPKPPERSPA